MISSFQPDLSPKTVLVLVPVHSLTHYTSYITVSHIHTCIQHYIYSICYVTVTKCSGTLRRSSPYIFRSKPKNQNYDYRNRATRNGSQNIKIEEINIAPGRLKCPKIAGFSLAMIFDEKQEMVMNIAQSI